MAEMGRAVVEGAAFRALDEPMRRTRGDPPVSGSSGRGLGAAIPVRMIGPASGTGAVRWLFSELDATNRWNRRDALAKRGTQVGNLTGWH
jgi:hypothetical protein